jgi:radial spoke head protein 9
MPDLNDQHINSIDREKSLFVGDPRKVIVNVENKGEGDEEEAPVDDPVEEDGEEGAPVKKLDSDVSEDEEIKIPPKNLSEIDRLVYIVKAVENDCFIVPIGAFRMTPVHQVRRNEAFKGLKDTESDVLSNYMHFRNAQTDEKKAALDEANAPFDFNFLEDICDDMPKGCWILQKTNKLVIIRSLSWPGYYFYHKFGTNKFGSIYMGDGLKNDELPF